MHRETKTENKNKKWLGVCPACKKWRHSDHTITEGGKHYCTTYVNFRAGINSSKIFTLGDARLYVRENLERFDNLGFMRNLDQKCGMELVKDMSELNGLKAYKSYTDFRTI